MRIAGPLMGAIGIVLFFCLLVFGTYQAGYSSGESHGFWRAAHGLCEEDMGGQLMELSLENWVQCVQYKTPAPLYPVKPSP